MKKHFGIFGIVAAVICVIVLVAGGSRLFESLEADQIMVIRHLGGDLVWHTDPGQFKWQGFGKVTKYDRSATFWFSAFEDQGEEHDQSMRIRFADKAGAMLSGSLIWKPPIPDETKLTAMHMEFGSQQAVEQRLIKPLCEKVVYNTGPLMTSMESAAERRNEIQVYMEDMMVYGIYDTENQEVKSTDPITGEPVTIIVTKILEDPTAPNGRKRQDHSPLTTFGIPIYNVAVNKIAYDSNVSEQITNQMEAVMRVQTAKADALEAEQKAITARKQGEAKAAESKWAQEVIKATEVTKAEQEKAVAELAAAKELEVAKLRKLAAAEEKQRLILLGQGEAERKKLVLAADGALEQKIAALVKINENYANAIKDYRGNWVPTTVLGGEGEAGGYSNGANDLINMLMVKTAQDLSLSMDIPAGKSSP